MDDSRFYYIPRRLNEPPRLIIFTLDEAIPAGLIFIIAMLAGYMLLGVLLSVAAIFLVKRFKAGRSRDYFKRKLYWHGFHATVKNQTLRKKSFFRGASNFINR